MPCPRWLLLPLACAATCTEETLFFSAWAADYPQRALALYNPTSAAVALDAYALASCFNGCDAAGAVDHLDDVEHDDGAPRAPVLEVVDGVNRLRHPVQEHGGLAGHPVVVRPEAHSTVPSKVLLLHGREVPHRRRLARATYERRTASTARGAGDADSD